jgi:hypothetical protein
MFSETWWFGEAIDTTFFAAERGGSVSIIQRKNIFARALVLAGLSGLAGASVTRADVVYWDGSSSGFWTDVNNWNTSAAGTGAAVSPVGNDVVFYATGSGNRLSSNVINGNIAINSLLLGNGGTGDVVIRADASNHVLTIGPGGITMQDGFSAILYAPIALSASQTWINNSTASMSINGPIDLGANTLAFSGPSEADFNGTISGAGGIVAEGTDDSYLVLGGNNTFHGPVAVNSGNVGYTSVASLGTGGSITLGVPGHANFINFIYLGGTDTLNKDIYAYSPTVNAILNRGGGVLTLSGTIHNDGVPIYFHDGTIVVTGPIIGTGNGNSNVGIYGNVVTLSNPNNHYDGATSVFGGGTLINGVTNALPTSTTLSIGDPNGAGTYNLNGHNQQLAGLTLDGTVGSTLVVQLNGNGTIDQINVPSITSLGANRTLEVDLVGGTPNFTVGESFQIFTDPTSWADAGSAFANFILPSGYVWDTSHLGTNGSIMLAVVPEPGPFVLGLIALMPALALGFRRRRRAQAAAGITDVAAG